MTERVAFPEDRTCPYHPPAAYDPLRGGAPLKRVRFFDGRAVWAVTGHAAARALLGDARLSSDSENEAFPVPSERSVGLLRRRTPLLGVDDPEHNRRRRLLIPGFTLKPTQAMRPRIQEIVDPLIDDVIAKGPKAELVGDFALPMPSKVICSMLQPPGRGRAAQGGDFPCERVETLGAACSEEQAVAVGGESAGGRLTDPAARSGDGDDFRCTGTTGTHVRLLVSAGHRVWAGSRPPPRPRGARVRHTQAAGPAVDALGAATESRGYPDPGPYVRRWGWRGLGT